MWIRVSHYATCSSTWYSGGDLFCGRAALPFLTESRLAPLGGQPGSRGFMSSPGRVACGRRYMAELYGLFMGARWTARVRFHGVQCRVCRAQQGIYFRPIFRISSDTNADRKLWLLAIFRETVADAAGY